MPTPHRGRYHHTSIFGDGPRHRLNREERAKFRFLAASHARARRLPAKQEKVAVALLRRLGSDGRLDPSHATLANDTGADERTVRRACDTLRALGLITWERRLTRDGWRVEQTSNAYRLLPFCCGGHFVRGTELLDKSRSSSSAPRASAAEIEAARASLAAIREARQGKLLGAIGVPA